MTISNPAKTPSSASKSSSKVNAKDADNAVAGKKQVINLPLAPQELSSLKPMQLRDNRSTFVAGYHPSDPTRFEVSETVNMDGMRPIATSDITVHKTMNMVGTRPISASELHISGSMNMAGTRPIASNDMDAAKDVLSFLD